MLKACKQEQFPLCLEKALTKIFKNKDVILSIATKAGFERNNVASTVDVWDIYLKLLTLVKDKLGGDVAVIIEDQTIKDIEYLSCTQCPIYGMEKDRKKNDYAAVFPSASELYEEATRALGTSTVAPSSSTINNGQTVSLTVSWSGGTAPYDVTLYGGTSPTSCSSDITVVDVSTGVTDTFAPFADSPSSTTYYATVQDSSLNIASSTTPVGVTVSTPASSTHGRSLTLGNVTVYRSTDSQKFILVTVNTTVSQMRSHPFLEMLLPQYGYRPNGTWGYLGYYQGVFWAVSGAQRGLTVSITVNYNGIVQTRTVFMHPSEESASVDLAFE